MIKNPIRFTNKSHNLIFIYQYFSGSFFQISILLKGETTIKNIQKNSYIALKNASVIGDMVIPSETFCEFKAEQNYYII